MTKKTVADYGAEYNQAREETDRVQIDLIMQGLEWKRHSDYEVALAKEKAAYTQLTEAHYEYQAETQRRKQ